LTDAPYYPPLNAEQLNEYNHLGLLYIDYSTTISVIYIGEQAHQIKTPILAETEVKNEH
jgi:hypothetical protein